MGKAEHARRYRWKNCELDREPTKAAEATTKSSNKTAEQSCPKAEHSKSSRDSGVLHKTGPGSGPALYELDIGSFLKTYIDRRTEDYTTDQRGCKIQRNIYDKKMSCPKYFVPLRFDEDVTFYRLEDQGRAKISFRDVDTTEIYRVDPKTFRSKNERLARKARPVGLVTKHGPCLPSEPQVSRGFQQAGKRPIMERVGSGKDLGMNTTKTTHLWEKHVMNLLSRRTAQWIANQCSSGEQRERLVGYLDYKYVDHYLDKGGASKVTKILDVNDDAICWPVKKKTHPENHWSMLKKKAVSLTTKLQLVRKVN